MDLLSLRVMIVIANSAFICKLDFFGIVAAYMLTNRLMPVMMKKRGSGYKQENQCKQYLPGLPESYP